MKVKVSEKLDDIKTLLSEIKGVSEEVGAVIIFVGSARGIGNDGGRVLRLEYDAYEEVAVKTLEKIIGDLRDKYGIIDAVVEHRIGQVNVGEDIVYVLVASKHREEGFKAAIEIVERLKREAPIWKKEITDRGARWIENI
ncbi:MAG: molybdenum cofactor biosynthesis protein MoaE [Candidatus Bathyarchaeia archaeon]|nr:molybdenum cofactor biosynthesis protein MoaE [Candidatus Bathyarchaeota archaeon]